MEVHLVQRNKLSLGSLGTLSCDFLTLNIGRMRNRRNALGNFPVITYLRICLIWDFFCYIYLLGSALDSIKAEASPSASTHLMDCLSTVQHFKHQHFWSDWAEDKKKSRFLKSLLHCYMKKQCKPLKI